MIKQALVPRCRDMSSVSFGLRFGGFRPAILHLGFGGRLHVSSLRIDSQALQVRQTLQQIFLSVLDIEPHVYVLQARLTVATAQGEPGIPEPYAYFVPAGPLGITFDQCHTVEKSE